MKADREQKRYEKQAAKCSDRFMRGLCATISAAVVYIVIPLVVEDAFFPLIPPEINLDALSDLLGRWLIAGIPLVIIAFPSKYYGLGTRKRLGFSVLFQMMKAAWLLYVISFGDLSGLIDYSGADMTLQIDLVINGLVMILVGLIALKAVIFYCDYRDNRDFARELNSDEEPSEEPIRVRGRFS